VNADIPQIGASPNRTLPKKPAFAAERLRFPPKNRSWPAELRGFGRFYADWHGS
jgi:hypothetical protein